jgi:hypothetical protein
MKLPWRKIGKLLFALLKAAGAEKWSKKAGVVLLLVLCGGCCLRGWINDCPKPKPTPTPEAK